MIRASWGLKCVYCIAILAAVVPIGLAASGWVTLTLGRSASPVGALTIVGPLILLAVGLYRIWTVVRLSGTLDSSEVIGIAKVLRGIGVLALYVGAIVAIVNWVAGPVMRMLITTPTQSGVEFYVVGVFLALLTGIGTLGLVLFELSRLLSFEAEARVDAIDA
jgi:hypothetical protein